MLRHAALRMGVSGQTTWPRHWRIMEIGPVEKVNIFAPHGPR